MFDKSEVSKMMSRIIFLFVLCLCCAFVGEAQNSEKLSFWHASDTFHSKRFWMLTGTGALVYAGSMYALHEVWYADYPRSKFHFFDDRGDWLDMDKAGHAFSAYTQAQWAFGTAQWMGISRRKSAWIGVGAGTLLQASIEVLDGFSEEWGFSVADIGFNTMGCALFLGQELAWQEQRIWMKVSSSLKPYSDTPIWSEDGQAVSSLRTHTNQLFGKSLATRILKDYNAQTIWLSANIASFLKQKEAPFPPWLNIAAGYGIQNAFGSYYNNWEEGSATFRLDNQQYPRYQQYFLALDIDLTKIKTKKPFLKKLLHLLNSIKIPSPALEFNSLGGVKFHPLYF